MTSGQPMSAEERANLWAFDRSIILSHESMGSLARALEAHAADAVEAERARKAASDAVFLHSIHYCNTHPREFFGCESSCPQCERALADDYRRERDAAEAATAALREERDEMYRQLNAACKTIARLVQERDAALAQLAERTRERDDALDGHRFARTAEDALAARAEKAEAESARLRELLAHVQRYGNAPDADSPDDFEDAAVPRGWFWRRDAALEPARTAEAE